MTSILPLLQPLPPALAPLFAAASAPGHAPSPEAANGVAAEAHGAGAGALDAASSAAGLDAQTVTAVIGFFLCILLVAYFAPQIVEFTTHLDRAGSRKSFQPSVALRSFSSGMAVAYVFVLLLPEFNIFQQKLILPGFNAFQVALVGLVFYKGLQHLCLLLANKKAEAMGDWAFVSSKQQERLLGFRVSTYVFTLYASLILLTLPFQLSHFPVLVDKVLYLLTFLLHLGFNLVGLYEENERHYRRFVPWVVSGGLALSFVLTIFSVLSTGVLLTALTFLAGVIIFSVFRNELPTAERSSFVWFAVGVAFFAVAQGITTVAPMH
jgi:hypothetical protein